jgi:hypothetical protein
MFGPGAALIFDRGSWTLPSPSRARGRLEIEIGLGVTLAVSVSASVSASISVSISVSISASGLPDIVHVTSLSCTAPPFTSLHFTSEHYSVFQIT